MLDRHAISMMVKYRGQFIPLQVYKRLRRERNEWLAIICVGLLVYWFLILPAIARIVERLVRG